MKKFFSALFCLLFIGSVTLFVACTAKTADSASGDRESNALVQEYKREGDFILFGSYAQTIKSDDVKIIGGPDDKGYYKGNDGEKYVKVTYLEPTYTLGFKNSLTTLSNGNSLEIGEDYFFKIEPIRWRILNETEDSALIVCDQIIEQVSYQPFYKASNDYSYIEKTSISDFGYYNSLKKMPENTFASNYKYSYIRYYLNDTFFNKAFSFSQKSVIKQTTVDNGASSALSSKDIYACQNTLDYIFLLSIEEMNKPSYGFLPNINSNTNPNCSARTRTTTDYGKAKGLYTYSSPNNYGNGVYFTRSPYGYGEVYSIFGMGESDRGYSFMKDCGIVPALNIRLK